MKNLIVIFLMSLVTTSVFAASPKVMKAVLSSKAVAAVENIDKIEVVMTYRCPNCYDIEVTGNNEEGEIAVKVHTEQMFGGPITVKLIESSK